MIVEALAGALHQLRRGVEVNLGAAQIPARRNPLAVLARGYCVAEKQGVIVRSADAITKGDNMNIRFYNGSSLVTVEQVDHERDL